MVAAAQRGQPYRTPYLVPGTGEEQLVDAAWSDEGLDDTRCVEVDEVAVAPSPEELAVQVRLSGLADGEDYRVVVTDPPGDDVTIRQGSWGAFRCVQLTVPDVAVGSGTWTVTALAGPEYAEVGMASYEVVDAEPECLRQLCAAWPRAAAVPVRG